MERAVAKGYQILGAIRAIHPRVTVLVLRANIGMVAVVKIPIVPKRRQFPRRLLLRTRLKSLRHLPQRLCLILLEPVPKLLVVLGQGPRVSVVHNNFLCWYNHWFMKDLVLALKNNGMDALVVESGQEAKKKVLKLIPKGAEVMVMSSVTLETIGLTEMDTVKKRLMTMDQATQGREMQKLGAAPEWVVGSVHAVTRDGKVVIASNTGSQLPAYVYGAEHVVWVVGRQKIVKDLDAAFKRVYEYVLPLESERVKKAYGMERSNVSKLLVINRETKQGRITVVLVNEDLGF